MNFAKRYGVSILAISLGLVVGVLCSRLSTPTQALAPGQTIEYPFDHPAAKEANELFLRLEVYSEEDYRNLPRRDRYLWDVSWFETEVMNGGVDQYFSNSIGEHALACVEALEAIGAKDSHLMLKQACDLFPDKRPSPNREVRQKQLSDLSGENKIDDLIEGDIEVDLYQHMLDYYHKADPQAK